MTVDISTLKVGDKVIVNGNGYPGRFPHLSEAEVIEVPTLIGDQHTVALANADTRARAKLAGYTEDDTDFTFYAGYLFMADEIEEIVK